MRSSSADGDTTKGSFRSHLVGVYRGGHFVYVGRVGPGDGRDKVKTLLPRLGPPRNRRSQASARRARRRA